MWISLQNNYHRISFFSAEENAEYKTMKIGNDIHGIIIKASDGSWRLQSVLFPREKYSVSDATIHGYYLQQHLT